MSLASYADYSASYALIRDLKTFPWLGTFKCNSSCTMTSALKEKLVQGLLVEREPSPKPYFGLRFYRSLPLGIMIVRSTIESLRHCVRLFVL